MFVFLDQLWDTLLKDTQYTTLLDKVHQNPTKHPDLKVYRELLFQNGRIWLSFAIHFTSLLLQEFHSSPIRGHIGVNKNFRRLQQNFDWPRILEDVRSFVS